MHARTHWWRAGVVAGLGHMNSRAFDRGRAAPPRANNTAAVLRATLIVVGVLAALYLAYLLRQPIAWLAIAAFVALALAPPVRLLSR